MMNKKTMSKTPNARRLNTAFLTPSASNSESDDSTTSGHYSAKNLSLVAEHDDLVRLIRQERNDEVENAFLDFLEQLLELYTNKWGPAVQECQRLQQLVDKQNHENRDLESKLFHARKLLDKEKEKTKRAMDENDSLKIQLNRVKEMLFKDMKSAFPKEAKEKLSFLNEETSDSEGMNGYGPQLSAIHEVNTTGSLLSDFCYSKSEDDIDRSFTEYGKTWKKHRASMEPTGEPSLKKRRSSGAKVVEINPSETVRATTTVTVTKEGPITATSIIESVPMDATTPKRKAYNIERDQGEDCVRKWVRESPAVATAPMRNIRQHSFQPKIMVMPENCGPCAKRMRFGKNVLKCKDCKALVHLECKNDLPLPCIPQLNTPTDRNLLGYIGDFTPINPPMVPAIIVHCLSEIERRGLDELGIYRVPGSERDVKSLKERFLKGKGSPNLTQTDIHVICGAVKDFLRSLHEPLVTFALWKNFVKAVEATDSQDTIPMLYEAISELPQPNRDTIAFLILHFKKVAEAKNCKMPIENLAKVFGPTLVGYSCADPTPENIFKETRQQVNVMDSLLRLPEDYWTSLLATNNNNQGATPRLQQTPSTDSLLKSTNLKFINRPNGTSHNWTLVYGYGRELKTVRLLEESSCGKCPRRIKKLFPSPI